MATRGTRMTATVAVIALPALLLAAACGGSDDEVVEVTGGTSCLNVDDVDPGDGTSFRDARYDCTWDVSDERLVGLEKVVNSCDFSEDGEVTLGECHGTGTIENDGGTWEGTYAGTTTWSTTEPAHVHHIEGIYVGTGGYDGLRLVVELDGTAFPWDVTGHIEPTG